MTTNFPSSIDAFTNPTSADTLDNPPHDQQHADINDAMEAVQTSLLDGAPLFIDDANERVGVGTTTPAYKLDVAGDIHIIDSTPHLIFTDTNTNAESRISADSGQGSLRIEADYNNESANTNILFFSDGTERMRIDSSGNVGIGTTSPGKELDVHGAGTVEARLLSTDGGDTALLFGDSVDSVRASVAYVTSANSLQLRGYNNSTRMTIDSSGNTTFAGYVSQPRAFFRSYKSGNTGWSLTGTQVIVFNNTVFNSGNNYSTSTGRFTAPIAGYYALGAHFFKYTTYTNSTNTYWGIFTSNGYSTTTNHGTQGQDGGQSLSTIVFMGQGDYADVQITSAGSTIQSYGTMSFNSFYGYLLSA